jgi:acyl-CoA thioester hydrolase
MEWGRTELIREAGMPYERVEKLGLMLPIVNLQVHFKQSAKYDEIVTIWTRIKEASALRMAFEYEIKQEDRLLVTGSSEHVWIASDYRPIRLDKRHPELFNFVQQLTTEME